MVRRYEFCGGRVVESASPDAPVHVYVAPDAEEKKFLVEELRVDEHTLASALDPEELARVEFETDHAALIVKRPKSYRSENKFFFNVASTGLFIFRDRLVIVIAEDVPLFEGRHFARIESVQDVVLRVIYRWIFHFEEHLKVINRVSDQLEDKIMKAMENKHLLALFALEKSLVFYVDAIGSNARVIEKLKHSSGRFSFSEEHLEFLDDITIENNQCREMAENYSQVLASLMDARASVVSNNLNVLMKTLTLVMIAIMLPTLIISVFSMNVKLPLRQDSGLVPFWAVMAMAGASTAAVLIVWRYKKW